MAEPTFEECFEDELRLSELLRLKVVLGALVTGAVSMTAISVFAFDPILAMSHGTMPRWALSAVGFAIAAPMVLLLLILMARGERPLPTAGRYLTVAMELCLPTLALWVLMTWLPKAELLASPAVLIYPVMIILYALRLDPKICLFAGLWAAAQWVGLSFIVRPEDAAETSAVFATPPILLRGVMLSLAGVATAFVAWQLRARLRATVSVREERAHIVQTFGRHVSPAVVEQLLQQRRALESDLKYVAVMFLDIRSFTTLSEGRSPVEVVDLLNAVFHSMIELVNEHNGFINKFLGDGFMAVFGAPLSDGQDAGNAVSCALAILERLTVEQRAGTVPESLRIGIGIHAGEAVTGNIGSEHRVEYTVIGDVVNVASRIEGLNKQYDATVLVSGEVWGAVADRGLPHEVLGQVEVKGRVEPVEVVRLA